MPERFNLHYIGDDGQKHQPFMVHRALLGSIERFFGILIEHYNGKFPTWLAPIQVKILSINDTVCDYCSEIYNLLLEHDIRVECDLNHEKIGHKIRETRLERVPYMIIIGKNEKADKTISFRSRDTGEQRVIDIQEFVDRIKEENKVGLG